MTPDILRALADLMAGADGFADARVNDDADGGELLVSFDGVRFTIIADVI